MKILYKAGADALLVGLGIFSLTLNSRAACNSPTGKKLTVSITAPTALKKLYMMGTGESFYNENTWDTEFTALTAENSKGNNASLTWYFPGVVFPSGNTGLSATIKTPNEWPNGSFFGGGIVSLNYVGGSESSAGDCSDSVLVALYFPKDEIKDGMPLWFQCWRDKIQFNLIQTMVYGGYSSKYGAESNKITGRVIMYDCISSFVFAQRVAHENHHLQIWQNHWPTGYQEHLDTDGDLYPDKWERVEGAAHGFTVDPSKKGMGTGDEYTNRSGAGYAWEEYECNQVMDAVEESDFGPNDYSVGGYNDQS